MAVLHQKADMLWGKGVDAAKVNRSSDRSETAPRLVAGVCPNQRRLPGEPVNVEHDDSCKVVWT